MTEWRTCSSHGRGTSTGSQNSRRSSPESITPDHRPPPLLGAAQFPTSGMKNNHGHPFWWRRWEAPECCCVRRLHAGRPALSLLSHPRIEQLVMVCVCCHLPRQQRWNPWEAQTSNAAPAQIGWLYGVGGGVWCSGIYKHKHQWFTKVHPFMSHLLFCSVNWLLSSLHSHKYVINKSRKWREASLIHIIKAFRATGQISELTVTKDSRHQKPYSEIGGSEKITTETNIRLDS